MCRQRDILLGQTEYVNDGPEGLSSKSTYRYMNHLMLSGLSVLV